MRPRRNQSILISLSLDVRSSRTTFRQRNYTPFWTNFIGRCRSWA